MWLRLHAHTYMVSFFPSACTVKWHHYILNPFLYITYVYVYIICMYVYYSSPDACTVACVMYEGGYTSVMYCM